MILKIPGPKDNLATFLETALRLTKNVAINKHNVDPLPPIKANVCICDKLMMCGMACPLFAAVMFSVMLINSNGSRMAL